MDAEPCFRCGAAVVVLPCFDGRRRPFSAVELSDLDVPESQRWFIDKRRGATPGDVTDAPAQLPFLIVHTCRATRTGTGQSTGREVGRIGVDVEIAHRTDEPRTNDLELSIPGRVFSYLYPSSWAHIVAGAESRGLCRDRVLDPDFMSDRERARLDRMRVCPRCRARNRRHESDGVPRS